MLTLDGRGVAQLLAALATAFFLRLASAPRPALPGLADDDKSDDGGEAPSSGENHVVPVTLHWRSLTCSLNDKSGKLVPFLFKEKKNLLTDCD